MKIPGKLKSFVKKTRAVDVYYYIQKKYKLAYSNILLNHFPYLYAQYRYKNVYGRRANIKTPATFDEKLLWLMLYWKHPLKTECGDKYTMRSYVQKLGWGHVLPELLGVYQNSNEINFDSFPSKFVLKCTHGCGCNIICSDKEELDKSEARRKLDKWMAIDYSKIVGELHYASMKPRIICEEFLDDSIIDLPVDYKVYCFGGKAHCILVALGRDKEGHTDKFDIYNLGWENKLPYYKTSFLTERYTPKPDSYDEMIKAAEALSKPFPFVRIDFYNIKGKAVLGEMTFTPAGCIHSGYTELGQNILGSLILLPPRLT